MSPKVTNVKVTAKAGPGFVAVTLAEPKGPSMTLVMASPEQILQLFGLIMDQAAQAWPGNEYIKEYLSE